MSNRATVCIALSCAFALAACSSAATTPSSPSASPRSAPRTRPRSDGRGLRVALEAHVTAGLLSKPLSFHAEAWASGRRFRARLRGAMPVVPARLGHLELRCCRRGLLNRWSGKYALVDHEKRTVSATRVPRRDLSITRVSAMRTRSGPALLGRATARTTLTFDLRYLDVDLPTALELTIWHTRAADLRGHARALLALALPYFGGELSRRAQRELARSVGFPLKWRWVARVSPSAVARVMKQGRRGAAYGALGALLPVTLDVLVSKIERVTVRAADLSLLPDGYRDVTSAR